MGTCTRKRYIHPLTVTRLTPPPPLLPTVRSPPRRDPPPRPPRHTSRLLAFPPEIEMRLYIYSFVLVFYECTLYIVHSTILIPWAQGPGCGEHTLWRTGGECIPRQTETRAQRMRRGGRPPLALALALGVDSTISYCRPWPCGALGCTCTGTAYTRNNETPSRRL